MVLDASAVVEWLLGSERGDAVATQLLDDPEGEFFRSIVDDQIFAAIEELPEEYRLVVVLSDLEDLSYGEIADVMEIPVGTVKSRLFRGRRQLQRRLYDYALEMGYISEGGKD